MYDRRSDIALPAHIVLYDGVCGLCHRTVAWLIARDRGRLYYAPLQGDTTPRLRVRFPDIPETLESVIYIDGDRLHRRAKAFLYLSRHLTRPWRWLYHFRWLPSFLIDLPYRLIARLRYRIWGKHDSCRIPDVKERERLLP